MRGAFASHHFYCLFGIFYNHQYQYRRGFRLSSFLLFVWEFLQSLLDVTTSASSTTTKTVSVSERLFASHHFYYSFGNFYNNQYERGFRISSFLSLVWDFLQSSVSERLSPLIIFITRLGTFTIISMRGALASHHFYCLFGIFYNHQYQYQRGFRLSSSFLLLVWEFLQSSVSVSERLSPLIFIICLGILQ